VKASRSDLLCQVKLRYGWHLDDEAPACLHQRACPGKAVCHDHQLGRINVESAAPCDRHDIVDAVIPGGHENGWPMINETVRLMKFDRLDVDIFHDLFHKRKRRPAPVSSRCAG